MHVCVFLCMRKCAVFCKEVHCFPVYQCMCWSTRDRKGDMQVHFLKKMQFKKRWFGGGGCIPSVAKSF